MDRREYYFEDSSFKTENVHSQYPCGIAYFSVEWLKAMVDERKAEQVSCLAGCIYVDGRIELEPGRLVLQHNY